MSYAREGIREDELYYDDEILFLEMVCLFVLCLVYHE